MDMTISRVVFDNNAWTDIVVRDDTGQTLARLQQGVARGRLRVFVTTALVVETAAYAATCPTEVRRRLAYMRALGHVLRPPQELMDMEIHGQATLGKLLLAPEDESHLYNTVLPIVDAGGVFVSPEDGEANQAASIIGKAKHGYRDAVRHVESGADKELRDLWERDLDGQPPSGNASGNELGLPVDASAEQMLQAWGKEMARRGQQNLHGWVTEFLSDHKAPASVVEAPLAAHPFSSAHVAYLYAHAVRHFTNGKLVEMGDFYDRQYCVLSVAADVLVSSDRSLRSTYDLMPFRPYALKTPQEFIHSITLLE